jgi:hypothetical protein
LNRNIWTEKVYLLAEYLPFRFRGKYFPFVRKFYTVFTGDKFSYKDRGSSTLYKFYYSLLWSGLSFHLPFCVTVFYYRLLIPSELLQHATPEFVHSFSFGIRSSHECVPRFVLPWAEGGLTMGWYPVQGALKMTKQNYLFQD